MDTIVLQGKKELDVFINPQRQRLLRCMNLAGEPLTPKQIADRMELSPSSVQHHVQKLLALGLVELHHTETIHGITARYYRVAAKTVRIGKTPVKIGVEVDYAVIRPRQVPGNEWTFKISIIPILPQLF